MAETGKEQSKTTWPLVKFNFQVKIGSDELMFQEVSGLNAEAQVIEYRVGTSKSPSTVKMPGIQKYGAVTFKKGSFKGDTKLWDFYNKVIMNTFERQTVTISLLDEAQAPVMTWNLTNAFPSKIVVTDMKADANEAAVEQMEMQHEGLILAK